MGGPAGVVEADAWRGEALLWEEPCTDAVWLTRGSRAGRRGAGTELPVIRRFTMGRRGPNWGDLSSWPSLHTGGLGPVRSQWRLLWSSASRLSISRHPALAFHLRRARSPVLSNTCLPTRQGPSHSSKRGTQKLCPWSRHLTISSPYLQNQCNYGFCLMPTLPISWMILFVQFGSDLTYTPRDNLTETWLQRRSLVKEEES